MIEIAKKGGVFNQNLNIEYTDIKDNKQKEKSKLEEERDNYKRTQLGAEGGKRMTLNFALILFTLVYVLRGLIFTLKWSIKTLKEE